MRRYGSFLVTGLGARRSHASYGAAVLSHSEIVSRFNVNQSSSTKSVLSLLEETEACIAQWKLNKWEFRMPLLVNPAEKEKVSLQLSVLKTFFLERGKTIYDVKRDIETVSSIGGISPEDVRAKNRQWLQDVVGNLRWSGEVNKAKELRDAFLRLEVYGSRDYRVLERMCAIYGMGLLNSFEDAFSNLIVEDNVTGKKTVVQANPFTELLGKIVTEHPHISLLYDFLGFNVSQGYRSSLKAFFAEVIEKKHQLPVKRNERLMVSDPKKNIIFFDFLDNRAMTALDDSTYGLPDFVYICGSKFYLITIASDNFWQRNRQLPHKKQMEGIGRRGSFVLGIPYNEVRLKNVLLPPHYVDKASLTRLLEGIFEMSTEESCSAFPWISLYDKELDDRDTDFAEMMKRNSEEEWLTL